MPIDALHLILPSTFDMLDDLVEQTQEYVEARTSDEDLAYRVTLLASEAVTNAIEHGNRLAPDKSARYRLWSVGEGFEFTVEDEGEGFDFDAVQSPLAAENLLADGGRGLFLMRELATSIEYENEGRRVRVRVEPQAVE